MSQEALHRSRPIGQTSGTAERPAQQVIGPVLTYKLDQEVEQLRGEGAWRQNGYNAKRWSRRRISASFWSRCVREPEF